ncbi:MAG: hypothetical protein MPJ50_16725 [Pirellulales bacterium]|nr:hypothetical protein [Pirellulales bacterium]
MMLSGDTRRPALLAGWLATGGRNCLPGMHLPICDSGLAEGGRCQFALMAYRLRSRLMGIFPLRAFTCMRSFVLIMLVATGFVVLNWMAVPEEPRKRVEPEHPWRRTVDGWVKATWLPKESPDQAEKPTIFRKPVTVPHPLYLAAFQVLAVVVTAVCCWPARVTIRMFHHAATTPCRSPHLAVNRFRA